jgi:cytochrome P450
MKSGSKNIPIGGDLFGQQMLEDPYSVYRELRERDPVHWDEHAKVWVLTRYDDVASMLNDKRFSSQRAARARQRFPQQEMKPLFETLTSRMSEKDEPDHTRLRALVHDAFTRSSVEQWEPLVQSRINHLLDLANAQRELEFVSGFAIPLPLMLIMEIVGVPPVDRQRIKAWCDDFANVALNFYANITEDEMRRGLHSVSDFRAYLKNRIEAMDGDRNQDLLSALVSAEHEGSRLSLDELLANVLLLLSAGNETTTCLLSNGLLALLRCPDQFQLLRENPKLISTAVEEFLRLDAPVQFIGRVATEDVQIESSTIRQGDIALAMLAAANRDPDHFSNPDQLDVTRQHVNHLSFGHGHHYCAGTQLARLEARLAFTAILERFESVRLDDSHPITHRASFNIRCPSELRLVLG